LRASNLIGYDIPGVAEHLIATLFADDTTVFLKKNDRLSDLMAVLDTWCAVSGAKFNKEKTEIIPIGQPKYHHDLVRTRKPTVHMDPIPEHIRIATDGEAVRILEAWYGNGVDATAIWTPTLEKIDATLDWWAARHPTLEGQKHIVQMTIGGMTQYLTKAQGMPKHVEQRLVKRVRAFL
ncbi:hypothetical protein WOLCODRAFT_85208, partial [Wolfiporia cocos MD-104 SS10]